MMNTTDLLLSPARATAAEALAGLRQANIASANDSITEDFLRALEEACTDAGIDFAIAASHAANECDFFRDPDFTQDRNAFGMGHPDGALGGIVFSSVRAGARFYAGELLMKLRRDPSAVDDARAAAPDRWDGIEAVVAGSLGTFPTIIRIADLNTRFGPQGADGRPQECAWMCDETGPEAICQKSRDLFPNLPSQPAIRLVTDFTFSIDLTERNNGMLTDQDAFITIHNNGNENSDRFQEREFVNNGGGDHGVIFHGAVDAGGVIQIMPLDRQGIHSGNDVGNPTSIAFEMCIGSEPWETVKENAAQFLAEIVTNSRNILDYGSFGPGNFSLNRVVVHRDWGRTVGIGSGIANGDCPHRLIETDGGGDLVIARAREIVAGVGERGRSMFPTPDVPDFVAADVERGYPSDHPFKNTTAFACLREWTVKTDTPRRLTSSLKAKEVGPILKAGVTFPGWYVFKSGNRWWVLTKFGTRVAMNDLTERVRVATN